MKRIWKLIAASTLVGPLLTGCQQDVELSLSGASEQKAFADANADVNHIANQSDPSKRNAGNDSRPSIPLFLLDDKLPLTEKPNTGAVSTQSAELTIPSIDGLSQITLPAGWKEETSLVPEAVIQASNLKSNSYMSVISEPLSTYISEKSPLATYEKLFLDLNFYKTVQNPSITGRSELEINGFPAVQFMAKGHVDDKRLAYLITLIHTPEHLYQVVFWTLADNMPKQKESYLTSILSFQLQ